MRKALDSKKLVFKNKEVKGKLHLVKSIISLLIICSMVILPMQTVSAASNVKSALGISKTDTDLVVGALAEMLLCDNGIDSKFSTYQHFWDDLMLIKFRKDVDSSKKDSNMVDRAIYYVNQSNSSTKDTVIVVDCKTECERGNHMYLVEFHINREGKIYGYNVWQY